MKYGTFSVKFVCSQYISDNWSVYIDLGGWEWHVGVLHFGELGPLHVLLETLEIAHALVERLQSGVRVERLAPGHLLAEVDMLEQDKVGDNWLGSCEELATIAEQAAELVQALKRSVFDTLVVVTGSEAHLSVVYHNFITDALQLISSGAFSRGGAESRRQELACDVLVHCERL